MSTINSIESESTKAIDPDLGYLLGWFCGGMLVFGVLVGIISILRSQTRRAFQALALPLAVLAWIFFIMEFLEPRMANVNAGDAIWVLLLIGGILVIPVAGLWILRHVPWPYLKRGRVVVWAAYACVFLASAFLLVRSNWAGSQRILNNYLNPPDYEVSLRIKDPEGAVPSSELMKTAEESISSHLESIAMQPRVRAAASDQLIVSIRAPRPLDAEAEKRMLKQMFPPPFSLALVHKNTADLEKQASQPGFHPPDGYRRLAVRDGRWIWVERVPVLVDGVRRAQPTTRDSRPIIEISISADGRERLAKVTREHIGERLAIVLGETVWSDPVIQSAISDGNIQLTGLSEEKAQVLAGEIKSGLSVLVEIIATRRMRGL
jgi:hypothetical protein